MQSIRNFKAKMLGEQPDLEKATADLQAASVPLSKADCRSCPDPCDEGHLEYPSKFDVDLNSDMLGSVKPYYRQVVISTGKSDWEREVTDAKNTLAAFLSETSHHPPSPPSTPSEKPTTHPGIFTSSSSTRLAILNGSHKTLSEADNCTRETVLVFPDYKMVTEVPRTLEGANGLWKNALDPAVGRAGKSWEGMVTKSYILPYSCVILLCSHKKRDNRCSIAAPKLEQTFIQVLEHEGYETHTQLEHPCSPALEDLTPPEETDRRVLEQLQALPATKKALILRNSHTGGHRYVGNCIIYVPQGWGIWYGRVSSHQVTSIVQNTIIKGQVLPPLVRGGINISKPGCSSLNEW